MASFKPNDRRRAPRRLLARVFIATTAAMAAVACGRESAAGDSVSRGTNQVDAKDSAALAVSDSAARDSAARARQDSINRAQPGYVIDSVLPVEEEMRRFQATLGDRPVTFSGGAATRDALVRAFIDAIERKDERSLRRLVVDRAEFAFLIYPTSPNTKPPYRLSPDIVWMQRSAATDKSVTRLLQRFGGQAAGYVGYSCTDTAVHQGQNRVWTQCVVRLRTPAGDSAAMRLFGPIVARAGTYKFLSLASGL
jgi:hypothetical protein